jgi:hypothetical protein
MSRAYTPGGRFDSDFEVDSIIEGINADLQRPVGTMAEWWVFDPVASKVDDVYDVGPITGGRMWRGPYQLPVIRALINQGSVATSDRGYYNADSLHLTLNAEDVEKIAPGVLRNPDLQNRGRIVWLGEVFRPYKVQQRGIVSERYSLVVVDCQQVMNDELVNDPQFQQYAGAYDAAEATGYGSGQYGYGEYGIGLVRQ